MDATNRLSTIAIEMRQLQNEIQKHHRVLNFLLRSNRTIDPTRIEACTCTTKEHIEGLEERQQALQGEQKALIIYGALNI
ncbi:hypothetical protein SESBI_44062 [Sesbania bispinosa]|nr:hypothetical protein SESBI_44062 [Sesbania bispinosa]